MGKLFGTDGIRGIANVELTCELAFKVGVAVTDVISKKFSSPVKILIGKDTRISSSMLECALMSGICSRGGNAVSLGVIPTPAVAFLVNKLGANAGIMVSASHNSFEFNGIKIFNHEGLKLSDIDEKKIESIILDDEYIHNLNNLDYKNIGEVTYYKDGVKDYIQHISGTILGDLSGLKVVFDCANGAASVTADELFSSLGVQTIIKNNNPNGYNINENCGSVHIKNIISDVKNLNANLGIAFDGDADRCLAVDNEGNILDGDFIMAICAKYLNTKNSLNKNTVVGTTMTNMGFYHFCNKNNLNFIASDVGDKNVLNKMLENNYNFGGEQSGHVIFRNFATTGDGQLTAVQLLNIIKSENKSLNQLSKILQKFPQVLINVKVNNAKKNDWKNDIDVNNVINKIKNELEINNYGRVVVRASGTEPLVRVMLEGKDLHQIEKFASDIVNVVEKKLSE